MYALVLLLSAYNICFCGKIRNLFITFGFKIILPVAFTLQKKFCFCFSTMKSYSFTLSIRTDKMCKQCRPRSNATECGIWSRTTLTFMQNMNGGMDRQHEINKSSAKRGSIRPWQVKRCSTKNWPLYNSVLRI